MGNSPSTRRDFLRQSTAAGLLGSVPLVFSTSTAQAYNFRMANDRPRVGCIGTGSRWRAVGRNAMKYGDVVAVCDVDARHAGQARDKVKATQGKKGSPGDVDVYEDYQKILERDDIDIVTIVTPDHWHTKPAIEAMRAGKDVYCEKPLTLTIEEGKQIRKVLDETGRVFQVGTQQRSEMGSRFLQAVALIKHGRIGKLVKVEAGIGGAPRGGPFPKEKPPEHLNWEKWLGQTPLVDYIAKRCHYQFRWWYEYSGGKMTDWGAHHVDIAMWAMGVDHTGPLTVVGTAKHPCQFKDGYPTKDDIYNAAYDFEVNCTFANDLPLVIRSGGDNGIMFTGTEGRFFVNRGKIVGAPVEELKKNPLPDDAITKIYKGKQPGDHMRNFFECVMDREQPISDVYTHHRAMTTCHLANIAIRLDRKINWDPETEQIVDDSQAQGFQAREQRKGYEIDVSL